LEAFETKSNIEVASDKMRMVICVHILLNIRVVNDEIQVLLASGTMLTGQ
jgi:hypothetical protein